MCAGGGWAVRGSGGGATANRLRGFKPLPAAAQLTPVGREPVVEVGAAAPPMAHDPVCGMEVDPAQAAATLDVDGTRYYFCSTGCRDEFAARQQAKRPA